MTNQLSLNHLISCEECGLIVRIKGIEPGQKAHCPRCGYVLATVNNKPYQSVIALSIACLIMLVLSISFPFMSFSVQGLSQEIYLLDTAKMLAVFQNSVLGLILVTTVLLLPFIYISLVLVLYSIAFKTRKHQLKQKGLKVAIAQCNVLFRIEPWVMSDVFLVGVLVSLVKIASLADVGLGSSFWAFCIYALLVVKCISMIDKCWLWQHFVPYSLLPDVKVGDSHVSNNHISCHICHQLNPIKEIKHQRCIRCQSVIHRYNPKQNIQKSWALLLAAIIFYIPANLYPMMYTVSLGNSEGSTIMEGVFLLWGMGSYPIAMVIFFASIFIPIAKMLALAWLYYTANKPLSLSERERIQQLKLYRITEFIGRWSMIDVFVVAILVALVQLQNLMAIYPGPAALSFAAVVFLTMLSAMNFDSRLLWKQFRGKAGIHTNKLNNQSKSAYYE